MSASSNARLLFQASPGGAGSSLGLLMIGAVFVIFYVLLILPVQRRQKKIQQMHRDLKAGDRVVTTGGLRGQILSVKDDSILIRVAPDQVKLELVRSAVSQVLSEEAAGK